MRLSALHASLLCGPPLSGAILAGVLVGVARKLAREPEAPATDFVVLGSFAAVSVAALAFLLRGAARVRRGAPTSAPRLWRAVPWTAASAPSSSACSPPGRTPS